MITRLRLFLRHQLRAWAELLSRRTPADTPTLRAPSDPQHPSTACRCFHVSPSPDYAPHVIHRPDCAWLATMCQLCAGSGHCQRCGGDGTDPGGKVDLFEDADVLWRAARRLDGDEGRALRTLLERIEGAP